MDSRSIGELAKQENEESVIKNGRLGSGGDGGATFCLFVFCLFFFDFFFLTQMSCVCICNVCIVEHLPRSRKFPIYPRCSLLTFLQICIVSRENSDGEFSLK